LKKHHKHHKHHHHHSKNDKHDYLVKDFKKEKLDKAGTKIDNIFKFIANGARNNMKSIKRLKRHHRK